MDYRLVILGSLLPDVLDKPLGFWLVPELVNHTARNLAHTAALNVLLLVLALVLWRRLGHRGLLVLATASAGHLLLDAMWQIPTTLWWPVLGWEFPRGTTTFSEWLLFNFRRLATSPAEVLGGAALVWFAAKLFRDKAVLRFVRSGTIG